eukprot:11187535-Lingulodinium_polyedra.AAC.1
MRSNRPRAAATGRKSRAHALHANTRSRGARAPAICKPCGERPFSNDAIGMDDTIGMSDTSGMHG